MDVQLGSLRRQLSGSADVIAETAITTPSYACCALAAVLLRALPLYLSRIAGLLAQAESKTSESGWSYCNLICCDTLTADDASFVSL